MPLPSAVEGVERRVGLRFLSLDGGGIRGLSLHTTPLPADYFDLIGGTSTGGLIAIMLGRLRLSAAAAIQKYEELAEKVFSEKKMPWKDGTFKATLLEKAIQDVVEETLCGEGPGALMRSGNTSSGACKVFVCTLAASAVNSGAGPTLFRTYESRKNRDYNCKIWEAARATTAAPTFFRRIKIGSKGGAIEYIDAGLGYNNPIKQVVAEGARIFGDASEVDCLISIGTGETNIKGYDAPNSFQKWLPLKLVGVLKAMVTDCSKTAEEMAIQYKNIPDVYHRFNVNRGMGEIAMEEWKLLSHIKQHTLNYLSLTEVDLHVEHVVDALVGNPTQQGCAVGSLANAAPSAFRIKYNNFPSQRVAHFVIRRGLLAEMDRHLDNAPSTNTPLVLLGMGGAGKTQLALAWCQKLVDSGRLIATLWVDASSPISVTQSYGAIANTISRTWLNAVSDNNTILFVKNAISGWRLPWVMVFDNFDNPKSFEEKSILHYIPNSSLGTVLFTSRNSSTSRLGFQIHVSGMNDEESLELLLLRPPPYTEHEISEGNKICDTLGHLALAIDQAGAYIRAQGLELGDFVTYYNKKKDIVFGDPPDLWEYSKKLPGSEKETRLSVFTTWELSLSLLSGTRDEVSAKTSLLSLAAFFDNAKISERYFHSYFEMSKPSWMNIFSTDGKWDSDAFRMVFLEMRKLSLIQSLEKESEENMVSLHPLISDWGKLRLPLHRRREVALEAIAALTGYLQSTLQTNLPLKTRQETTLHLKAICLNETTFLQSGDGPDLGTLVTSSLEFAKFFQSQGLSNDAIALYTRAIAVMERAESQENEIFLDTLLNLAVAYRKSGNYKAAQSTCDRVHKRGEETLGNSHPIVLAVLHEEAELARHQGHYDMAEELHARCLRGRETTLGSVNPCTLESVQNMAEALRRRGKFESAEVYQKRALKGYIELYGNTDPEVLRGYHQLGAIMRDNAQYAEAEGVHRQALKGREGILGPDHPDTLNSLNNLGLVLRDEKKYEEAEHMHRRALEGRQRTLGLLHPQTITSRHNLAKVLQDQGKHEKALDLQQQAIAGYEEVLGKTHPYTLTSVFNLGTLMQCLGDLETAKSLHEQVLLQRESKIGVQHPDTLTSLKTLADVLVIQGQYSAARALYQRCYDGRKKVLKENHPQILECKAALDDVHQALDLPKP